MKEKSKKFFNKAMREKVTPGQFFKVQWKILKELYGKYRKETTAILILSVLAFGSKFIELKFLEHITDGVSGYLNETVSFQEIVRKTVIFLILLLFVLLVQNAYNRLSPKYESKIILEVEKKINDKLSDVTYEYYESNEFYEKINLARQAGSQYPNAVYGVTQLIRILVMLVVYTVLLSKIHLLYVLVIFVSIAAGAVVSAKVTDKQLDYWRMYVSPETRRNVYFKSVFRNRVHHQNIQNTRSIGYFFDKYRYYNNRERKNYLKLNLFSVYTELITSVLFLIVFFLTAVMTGKGTVSGRFTIGYYSMVIALLVSLFTVLKEFTLFMLDGNWYVKVLSAYYDLLELNKNDTDRERGEGMSDTAIFINGLKYKYAQAQSYALKGIDISFKKGEKVAVVGYNGSGKTTLISVVLGLLKKYEGSLRLNCVSCTAVLQDFGQYQMTVKENIELGCGGKSLPDEKIVAILKKVNLYDFIASKPEGIRTMLGQLDKGVELSKGQWRRLAIARLLADEEANVWVLDEPTAFLDPLAEIEMYRFIFSLAEDRLVFFISHRLGFAKNAERIIVINDGCVVEDGTHTELMSMKNGIYKEMFESQKKWYA